MFGLVLRDVTYPRIREKRDTQYTHIIPNASQKIQIAKCLHRLYAFFKNKKCLLRYTHFFEISMMCVNLFPDEFADMSQEISADEVDFHHVCIFRVV